MLYFRYVVAFVSGCLIIAAGAFFCMSTRQKFIEHLRESVRAEQATGTLPLELKDVDPDAITPEGWNIESSPGDVYRVWIADMFSQFWFVFGPIVFAVCLGIAFLLGKSKS